MGDDQGQSVRDGGGVGFGQGGHYALSVCGEDRVVRDWWVMVGGVDGEVRKGW